MKKRVLTVLVLVMCLLLISYPWINTWVYETKADKIENTVTIKVTWKERVSYSDIYQQHYYLIYGELPDGTPCVLQNTDSRQRNKYNGSDLYQQIELGRVYTFFTTGERNPQYARYPNIIKIIDEAENWNE